MATLISDNHLSRVSRFLPQSGSISAPSSAASQAGEATPAIGDLVSLSQSSPTDGAQQTQAELRSNLANMLGASATELSVSDFRDDKGFNASNFDFPVEGELQFSGWTKGLEVKFQLGEERFVYRGLDSTTGRYGLDVEHDDFWKLDQRGIYVPTEEQSGNGDFISDFVGTVDEPIQSSPRPSVTAPSRVDVPKVGVDAVEGVGSGLAAKLGVDRGQLSLTEFEARKGFNAGDFGFPVAGELAISAWTEGLELKFQVGEENFVYRGLDITTGRYAVDDKSHEGYWKVDDRGIYIPDRSAPSNGWGGFIDDEPVGTID